MKTKLSTRNRIKVLASLALLVLVAGVGRAANTGVTTPAPNVTAALVPIGNRESGIGNQKSVTDSRLLIPDSREQSKIQNPKSIGQASITVGHSAKNDTSPPLRN